MVIKEKINLGKNLIQKPKTINAFMGVSLGRPFFSKENIEKYFLWASKYCKKFLLILADEPERWNYQVFKNIDKKQALYLALKTGKEYKQGFEKTINKYSLKDIKIKTWKELFSNDQQYERILDKLYKYFKRDRNFGEDIIETTRNNLKLKNIDERLPNYLIEETAAIIWLTKNDFPVEINHNSLAKINKNIYSNKYPKLTKELNLEEKWGYIQLDVE